MEKNVQDNIKVSICCLAYNHSKYMRQCLDSFLMQNTDFGFEVLIHDDASVDNTAQIIKEYEKQYPEIIKPVYQEENKFSKEGGGMNMRYNFPRARGKYIALCEGDDYWTDPLKLQKQVDFLEANKEFVICSHNSNIINSDASFNRVFNEKEIPEITDINFILSNSWYIPTASIVFRNSNIILSKWFNKCLNGDYLLQLILTTNGGLVYYENEIRSSYRLHSGGISNIFLKKNVFNYSMLDINKKFNKISKYKYYSSIRENIIKYSFDILNNTPVMSIEFWKTLKNLIWFNHGLNKKQFKLLLKRIF